MIVEEFWKKNQAWNPKDDFDKQTVRFNYWDMLDFAEQYAAKQLELTAVSHCIAKEYAEFCVRCDRDGLPLLNIEDYIKQYCG